MIKKIIIATFLLTFGFHYSNGSVSACELAPKTMSYFYHAPQEVEKLKDVKGVLYGKVLRTKNGGRKATFEVFQGIGDFVLPSTIIELPTTIANIPRPHPKNGVGYTSCDGVDFSDTFDAGQEYLVFFSHAFPMSLLEADGYTSIEVVDGHTYITPETTIHVEEVFAHYEDTLGKQSKNSEQIVTASNWRMYSFLLYLIGAASILLIYKYLFRRR
ncbi:hypothetical protein GCM10008967_36610 [Bacillus carboniphilus]|uniref:Uncharacterized protein n=1 Tax=Bacillus carboniphilus TaxID=86663 RepID=A0ABP3GF78_9BACI